MDIEISERHLFCAKDFDGIIFPKTFFADKPLYSFQNELEMGHSEFSQRVYNVSFVDFCAYLAAQKVKCFETNFSLNAITATYKLDKAICKITFCSEPAHIVFDVEHPK